MSLHDIPLTDKEKETCAIYVMRMALEDYADKTGVPYADALLAFARSQTYDALFDAQTGLWREGPDYIREMFEQELAGNCEKETTGPATPATIRKDDTTWL